MANNPAVLTDATTLLTDAESSGSSWTAASNTKNLSTDNVDLTGIGFDCSRESPKRSGHCN